MRFDKKRTKERKHGRHLKWAEWNIMCTLLNTAVRESSTSESSMWPSSRKHFRSILFKRLPQNGADLIDGLLNNDLFVCMTVPLKCLIQPQTGVTGTYVSLPACTSCMSVLNPLNRTDWPALFPGISKITLYKLKCLMKDRVPYENAKISSSSYISAITHANGLLPSPDHSARNAGLQIMRVFGYKTSNVCKKQERGWEKWHTTPLKTVHTASLLHLSSFQKKLNENFIQE